MSTAVCWYLGQALVPMTLKEINWFGKLHPGECALLSVAFSFYSLMISDLLVAVVKYFVYILEKKNQLHLLDSIVSRNKQI